MSENQEQPSPPKGNGSSKSDIISLSKVGKSFWRGKERLDVLKELDLTMKEGAFEALMGPSG
jgi:putative ABC transport system ATP-binding protein